MTQRGRPTTGPKMVHKLDGSEHAKERLETILRAIAGEIGIPEACRELGIEQAHFHRLRDRTLQTALGSLEPRPAGRPPSKTTAQDEPTGNLDPSTGARIEDLLLEMNRTRRTALVVVTHNERLAGKLGRAVVLAEGRLGPPGPAASQVRDSGLKSA